jgi:uncharacterized protein YecE (DUF72 family)
MPFDRQSIQRTSAALAARGVFLGASSWKYPGWRGKFSRARFDRDCLAQYAKVFKTVCVDAAYYTFPTVKQLESLAAQVPADFRFAFKVTDDITVKKFPNLPRFGRRAGQPNENYLNAGLFAGGFLKPCEVIRPKVGILIFELSRFFPADYARGRDFVAALDAFLGALPGDWPYGVEMRNKQWLQPGYFDCLARHRTAHVFNSWTAMPGVDEQMALSGSRPNPDLVAARFLLKPGRSYEDAVKTFQPYDQTREINVQARQAGTALIREGLANPRRKTFLYVNNRLEGNALQTISAMLEALA